VRCRAHNRLWAEQAFGRNHVERAVHLRQRKYAAKPEVGNATSDSQSSSDGERWLESSCDAHEKVILALTRMGFRSAQARRAVTAVEKRQGTQRSRTLEALLREAVLEATRAA
jgi:Holliday junction resolvasome RuvABC DNA-binding subunit